MIKMNLLFIATHWGPKYGGINSFNMDLCNSMQKVSLGVISVYCLVLNANQTEKEAASKEGITLISLDMDQSTYKDIPYDYILHKINSVVNQKPDWIIGHDVITGYTSFELCKHFKSQLALIHHMDYSSYKIYQKEDSQKAYEKVLGQKNILKLAKSVFSVGPFLRDSATDLIGTTVTMLVPGIVDIKNEHQDKSSIKVITYGRLSDDEKIIKQHELAIKSISRAVKVLSGIKDVPPNIKIILIGVENSEVKSKEYLKIAEEEAGRKIPVMSIPFIENRDELLAELSSSDLCLMLSLHEGFGLVGWEAISAEVPLMLSKNSGLYKFLFDLGGPATGCITAVDITGIEEKDIETVSNAISRFIVDKERHIKNSRDLKKFLIAKNFTWETTALTFLNTLGIEIKNVGRKKLFKFLNSFTEADAEIFFGRETESRDFLRLLETSNLTLLLGKSGVGKTSFIKAAILPSLALKNILPIYIRCRVNLIEEIYYRICELTGNEFNKSSISDSRRSANAILEIIKKARFNNVIVFLDQFEEVFINYDQKQKTFFFNFISNLDQKSNGLLKLVFSFREDFMAEFNDYQKIIPSIFGSIFRLKQFGTEKAIEIILRSLETAELNIESALLNELIDALSEAQDKVIDPAQMQIVLTSLYNNLKSDELTISYDNYNSLGGVKGILSDYVDNALDIFSPLEKTIAKEVMKTMVSARNTRVPMKYSQINEIPIIKQKLNEIEIDIILNKLIDKRIIIRKYDDEEQYELTHEYLINKIKDWIDTDLYRQKEIQDLLRQEENNWKIGHIIMNEAILSMIYRNKDHLLIDNFMKGLILRASIEYDNELEYWIIVNSANDEIKQFILDATNSLNKNVKLRAFLASLQLLSVDESLATITEYLKEIGNPNFLRRLETINNSSNKLKEPHLKLISDCIDYRLKKNMLHVDEGNFIMGRDPEELDQLINEGVKPEFLKDETPKKIINASGFWIDKYLVTNEEYKEFDNAHIFNPGDEKKPVTDVNWYAAKQYAEWLGKDLPTEEEWEKAARGCDGRLFPWGNEWDPHKCNTRLSGISGKTNVNEYPQGISPYGCFDMAGNVWEWTNTWKDYKKSIIVRGGSWTKMNILPWCSYKFDYDAAEGQQNVGFRCVIRDSIVNQNNVFK